MLPNYQCVHEINGKEGKKSWKEFILFVTCLKFSQKAAVSRLYELIKFKIMVNLVYTYESEQWQLCEYTKGITGRILTRTLTSWKPFLDTFVWDNSLKFE